MPFGTLGMQNILERRCLYRFQVCLRLIFFARCKSAKFLTPSKPPTYICFAVSEVPNIGGSEELPKDIPRNEKNGPLQ